LLIPQRTWTKIQWATIFISLFGYFIGFKIVLLYFGPKNISIELLVHHVFTIPFVMDYVVVITSCFFLQNMYVRFQTLNDLWKCLPADLVPVSDQWTHFEIVVLMENTRLLHAELCDLLNMFTLGYGPMLLGFFIFKFINMITSIYLFIIFCAISKADVIRYILTLLIYVQCVTFLMSIITFVSFINEKVTQTQPLHPHIIYNFYLYSYYNFYLQCFIQKLRFYTRLSIKNNIKKYPKKTKIITLKLILCSVLMGNKSKI